MYTLGIDIGSTTSKCVILRDAAQVVCRSLRQGGAGTGGAEEALAQLWEQSGLKREDMAAAAVTGYGRRSFPNADGGVSELTCHALGARFVFPAVRSVIDIGGQDAKVIVLAENGRMLNFVMNDKCAAGTGRFLEVMATLLRLDVGELGELARQSTSPIPISSTCTVFAESEVISQLAGGAERTDLVAGICGSVVSRAAALARRAGVTAPICMSGGVAGNTAIREMLGRELGTELFYDPQAQYFGALGAAIWAARKAGEN